MPLTLNDYQTNALATAAPLSDADRLANAILGVIGEASELARHALAHPAHYDPDLLRLLGWIVLLGDLADATKKHRFQGHDNMPDVRAKWITLLAARDEPDSLRPTDIGDEDPAKEIGDLLWYVALAARSIGVPLSTIAEANLDKLARRYPTGAFRETDSINRQTGR
jgi:NTP pyrophosphatase (non-canonical NTP hydrolase)